VSVNKLKGDNTNVYKDDADDNEIDPGVDGVKRLRLTPKLFD